METKSFQYWKTQEVEEVFGINLGKDETSLKNWLNDQCKILPDEMKQLDYLKHRLIDKVAFWNEAAIKFYFLGPLMNLVDYDTEQFNSFLEQSLSIQIDENNSASGKLDFLVATGKQIPRTPFFTLHEYKPEPNTATDPLGQLLVAMVAAQKANEAIDVNIPLYGTYVVGRFWFFVLLEGNTYTKSLAFDATQEDLEQIFCILRGVKSRIHKNLEIVESKKNSGFKS